MTRSLQVDQVVRLYSLQSSKHGGFLNGVLAEVMELLPNDLVRVAVERNINGGQTFDDQYVVHKYQLYSAPPTIVHPFRMGDVVLAYSAQVFHGHPLIEQRCVVWQNQYSASVIVAPLYNGNKLDVKRLVASEGLYEVYPAQLRLLVPQEYTAILPQIKNDILSKT